MSHYEDLIPSHPDEPAEVLRTRFHEWGYLFLKNAVAREKCDALLQDLLSQVDQHIVWDADRHLPRLTGQAFTETDHLWDETYPHIQSLESFHGFFHDEHMLSLMRKVSGDDVFVYPMKMARISTPQKIGFETPPHQDARSHVAGPTMAGIWVALHDVNEDMGRLKILPRSHTRGVREVFSAEGVGNVQCEIFEDENCWHVSDVEQGDVIVFNSCTVHAAQPNTHEDAVRMSVDTRFCDYGAPVFSSNLEPHHGWRIPGLDWERIYQGWQRTDLQHYWKDYPNLF